jgi:hypothetical protein
LPVLPVAQDWLFVALPRPKAGSQFRFLSPPPERKSSLFSALVFSLGVCSSQLVLADLLELLLDLFFMA